VKPVYDSRLGLIEILQMRVGEALPQAAALRRRLVRRSWRRGEVLFRAGERITQLAVIKSGLVKLTALSEEGTERILEFIVEGQVAACVSTLDGTLEAACSATACEDTTIEALVFEPVRLLAETEPLWARCLNLLLSDAARHLSERERMLLTLSPPERFAQAIAERPWLIDRVTQQDLAAYIGITPVSLSRLRARERRRADATA